MRVTILCNKRLRPMFSCIFLFLATNLAYSIQFIGNIENENFHRDSNNGSFTKEDFCVSTSWEDSTGINHPEEEAITLRCDLCSENVIIRYNIQSLEIFFERYCVRICVSFTRRINLVVDGLNVGIFCLLLFENRDQHFLQERDI